MKIQGVTVKVTKNMREERFKILAYRKGEFKRAYKATLPMCTSKTCKNIGPQTMRTKTLTHSACTRYHQGDIDALVIKLVKSYT
jgi:hypothetical protein